jgi:hypothetical protein
MGTQYELEVARAMLVGIQSGTLTRVNGLAVADEDGTNLKQSVLRRGTDRQNEKQSFTRHGTDGEKAEGVVGGLDVVDWFYVAERAARFGWSSLDVRCGAIVLMG